MIREAGLSRSAIAAGAWPCRTLIVIDNVLTQILSFNGTQ